MNTFISERFNHIAIESKIIVAKIIIPKAINVRYILRSDESISILVLFYSFNKIIILYLFGIAW